MSSTMKWLAVVVVLLSLDTIHANYQWSEWFSVSECSRLCSVPYGRRDYRRDCLRHRNGTCVIVPEKNCQGKSTKNDSCYVATQCEGDGEYIGEWTDWRSARPCSLPSDPCTGVVAQLERRCVLPKAYSDRWRKFRCPGPQALQKTELCPCEMSHWSEWMSWSKCEHRCADTDRIRRRSCVVRREQECKGSSVQIEPCPTDPDLCKPGRRHGLQRREAATDDEEEDGGLPSWVVWLVIITIIGALASLGIGYLVMKRKHEKTPAEGEEGSDKPLMEGPAQGTDTYTMEPTTPPGTPPRPARGHPHAAHTPPGSPRKSPSPSGRKAHQKPRKKP